MIAPPLSCAWNTQSNPSISTLVPKGITEACDESVIPLNTYIEIEGYGVRKCQDTGSKIINKRLDLYFDSHQEALKFGKKKLKVYLAKEQEWL